MPKEIFTQALRSMVTQVLRSYAIPLRSVTQSLSNYFTQALRSHYAISLSSVAQSLCNSFTHHMQMLRNSNTHRYADVTQFQYAALLKPIRNSKRNSNKQFPYAIPICQVMRLHIGSSYAEILLQFAMGNMLMSTCDIVCFTTHKDVMVACTTEMPLEIKLVKAQCKVWE